jgi:hypothetical protein
VTAEQIKSAALAQAPKLFQDWFSRGRLVGKEFKIGSVQGDAGDPLSINVTTGLWADFAASDKGGDLIDLRAAMRHGGDRIAAATELGGMFGIIVNGKDSHPKLSAKANKISNNAEDWHPIIPTPPDAPRPNSREFDRFDHTFDYRDTDDRLLFYIRRREGCVHWDRVTEFRDAKVRERLCRSVIPAPRHDLNALEARFGSPPLVDAIAVSTPDYSWKGSVP